MNQAPTPFFSSEAFEFLRMLSANNNRDYFTKNRTVFEDAVKGPLERLTEIAKVQYGPGKVMRQNRDVRFSADKSPYKTTASMWAGDAGGVYLNISSSGIQVGGGLYDPTRDQLSRGRDAIAVLPVASAGLKKILEKLESSGFELAGPSLVTTPKGYEKNDPNIELLRLKHYAALKHLPVTATFEDIENAWIQIEPLIKWATNHVGPAVSWP